MAAAVTHRGQRSPEPNDGFDDFARFQSGAAVVQGHPGQQQQQQDDYYDDDEDDPNFEPQNGYADDDDLEYDEQPEVDVKKKKERKPREPIRMPKVDLKAKFTAMNERVKKARMPSPHELKEGYLNSSFHKSFHQPLAVRSREMDDPEELEQRQALVKTKSPAELSQISSLSDLPVPTPIKNLLSPSERAKKAEEKKKSVEEPNEDSHKAWGMYSTLPRSMRETKLVTNCREMNDESELKQRQELVQSKNPTQLAEIHGLSDLPIPTKLEKIFKKPRSRSNSITEEKRARSESLPRTFGGTMYGTLPKSWRQQNLITQVKVEEDPDVLEKRRALTESKTPAELSQITSLSDLPIPTALEKYIKKPPKTETDSNTGSSQQQLVNRFRNLDSMYDTLPKSLKTEVLVRTKIETDEEVLKKRQEIVETKKPAELSQIQSLSDFPLPTRIENMFKTKEKDENASAEDAEKKKMNLSPSHLFSYEALPDSLKTEVLVRTKVEEDPEVLRQRQETVQTKSPAELSRIHGFEDFPLPQKIETLVRTTKRHLKSTKEKEDMKDAKSKSWSSLPSRASLYDALPESLKTEVLVRSRVETPELQKERAETVKTKSVAELSQINSLSEFPLPKPIENLINTENKLGNIFDKSGGEPEGEPKTLRENFYDTLPRSLKSEVLVRVRDEDPEIQRQRQELTRAKSPTELSQIGSLSDFPIPTTIENLIKKKSAESSEEDPVPPPRRFKKETIYESLPDSLKTEVLVRTKIESDEKVLQRQELCRSKSPVQLSEIHDFSEIPLPTFVENLGKKTFSKKPTEQSEEAADTESPPEKKTFYDQLPESLRQECLVRSRFEDPAKQRMRAEIVKSKSVNELSQITSLNDFPLPATIENLIQRGPRPVERKKRFREKQRSLSAKNLRDRMYDTLPKSLKSEVLVKSKIEDPEVREERKKLVQSKSVNELSQINSLSDIPLPGTIEKLIAKAKPDPNSSTGDDSSKCQSSGVPTPAQIKENIYASLPRSLKSEVLVRTRVESPDVLKERQQLAQSKSVSELSQMRSISDLPIPTTIENLIQQAKALKEQKQEEQSDEPVSHARSSPGGGAGHYDIYASLPRSLKKEVMVRSKIEEDEELVRKRQALTESKTPAELSQINSFSEIPLPRRIEDWLHHSQEQKEHSEEATPRHSRSFHELRSSVYETIPKSLKEPTLVRSKIEDPEIQRERCEITRTKTPSQLAEFHNISDIPIPGLWERGRESRKNSCKVERSLSIPKNPQELKEIVYNKMMPESLTKPCVVRCKFEDPEILLKHQQVQQSKSIHELSKIRNLNEFPLPLNLRLPDLPLPSAKKLLKIMAARTPAARKPAEHTNGADTEISPASTPRTHDRTYTDDEMLRYDTGSPDSIAHREQDFGYEVIEPDEPLQHFDKVPDKFLADLRPQQQQEEEQDEESLAEQYRGTPPLRTKKKKQYRYSHEISDQVQITDEPPPPLPPKRPAGGTGTRRRDDQRQRSDEDYETDRVFRSDEQQFLGGNEEPREILEENLGSNEMLLYVEPEDNPPVASLRKKHSMSGTAVQATLPPGPRIAYSYQVSPAAEEVEDRPASQSSRIQNRPLPAPPAPTRSLKKGTHRRTPSPHAAGLLARSSSASQADQFHSVASTLDRTLVDSSANRRRPGHHSDENDDTLADSIVDSMHSCADTLVGNGDDLDDATLHSCADTLADHDSDEEFFSEHLDVGGRQWRAAELSHDDDDTPTVSAGSQKK